MLFRRPDDMRSGEITPESLYLGRREFIRTAGVLAGAALIPALLPASPARRAAQSEANTPLEDVTGYNNYYEFGTDKSDPARNAGDFRTRPWTVEIAGEVARPTSVNLEDILHRFPPQER